MSKRLRARIESLQKSLDAIAIRENRLSAQIYGRNSLAERRAETRRKILLGAFVLNRLRTKNDFFGAEKKTIKQELDTYLRTEDRRLFAFLDDTAENDSDDTKRSDDN